MERKKPRIARRRRSSGGARGVPQDLGEDVAGLPPLVGLQGEEERLLVREVLLDAIYRLPESHDTEAALSGEPVAHDRLAIDLAAQLAPILAASPGALVLAPLAVGGHVDHRVVHRVALDLARGGRDVAFYEDFPYALKPAAVELRLAAIGGDLHPTTFAIEATIDRKIEPILAYTSQIDYLFGDREQAISVVTRYALAVGLGAPAERLVRFG